MGVIKNLNNISDYLTDEDTDKLEFGASLFKRYGNISFEILESGNLQVVIAVEQGQSSYGNYLDKKELVERAKHLFGGFLPNHAIHGRPLTYSAN